ncbi:MAG: hypothetical protein UW63_C0078G0002 [Candidatus Uhrbacteria bacterium GW2011_GWF2_44_350]|uniref:Uncharacterized protein n=1 Tax=Candidatus Uhrbacteria bacterium GW2011_GWF2_44_350 TaxID=1619000 RepID=A0A0G1J9Q9_9BACT|nr:MAG: hypothetical protein UW63_C0078G0002 [Candidatus Uhrbacteria bacterium GW2011_GWF2_44_350]
MGAVKVEAEKIEYKTIARREIREIFSDVLESTELEKRLQEIDNVRLVTPEQMDEIAKTNLKDAGAEGLIRYEIKGAKVRRVQHSAYIFTRVGTFDVATSSFVSS